MADGQRKAKIDTDQDVARIASLLAELPTPAREDKMSKGVIRKMAHDHRKSFIGEIARRQHRNVFAYRRARVLRRRFMAP